MSKIKKYLLFVLLFLTVLIFDSLLYHRFYQEMGERFQVTLDAVWEDIIYFPVPESSYDTSGFTVSYTDSWMESRKFGGERVHEGCDLMAAKDMRGHYPVISISDGIVEKIGWLKLGGYRIGIRSPHGVYFYYAHLNDYAKDFTVGEEIKAGELLGFMGDTGYSETEGTTGMFPVHLHVGIYLNDAAGKEVSYNPYPFLQELESHKLKFCYE